MDWFGIKRRQIFVVFLPRARSQSRCFMYIPSFNLLSSTVKEMLITTFYHWENQALGRLGDLLSYYPGSSWWFQDWHPHQAAKLGVFLTILSTSIPDVSIKLTSNLIYEHCSDFHSVMTPVCHSHPMVLCSSPLLPYHLIKWHEVLCLLFLKEKDCWV